MRTKSLREVAKLRAEEAAAHIENDKRDHDFHEGKRNSYIIMCDIDQAVDEINEILKDAGIVIEPSELIPIKRRGWKKAWTLRLDELDFEVRQNTFTGLYFMDGSPDPENNSADQSGKKVETLADLAGVL